MNKKAFIMGLTMAAVVGGLVFGNAVRISAEEEAAQETAAPKAEEKKMEKAAPVATSQSAEEDTTISRSALCEGVEEREPQGKYQGDLPTLDASEKRVTFWTEVKSKETPTKVKHVWSVDGESVGEVPLNINYPRTRTWSSKNIWAGDWKVEAITEGGSVLASANFKVAKASE